MPIEMIVDDNHIFPNVDDQDWILDKPISVLALDPADRRVLKVADQRDAVQKKTFTKWMNFYLSKRNGLYVDDLYLDLRDGHLLLSLLEIFTNKIIPRERGTSKFHALRNIEQCLECLEHDHNIRLVNIRPEELLNGNPKLTLGLIWRIILHFQFSDIPLPPSINPQETVSSILIPESNVKISTRKSSIDHIPSNYRQMLLIWAREQCQHYPGIYIEDFTQSWRNGRAFLAILHRHNPQYIDIKQMYRSSNRENLTQAFEFAQKHYGITQLIDPEDVDTDEPDEKSILLYISHLYKACPTLPNHPFRQEHDQIRFEGELSNEYINLTSELLTWIKTKLDFLHREIKFETIEDFQTFENLLQIMKNEELENYHQLLHRLRSIDAEFKTLQINEILQPDIESIDLAWIKLEQTINQTENNLNKSKKLKVDLDLIEHDINNIELKSKQLDNLSTINYINEIQLKLEEILSHCRTLSLPNQQIQFILEKIDQLNSCINIHLTSASTITNGFHHNSQQPVDSTEQLHVIVNEDLEDLIEELYSIDSNLYTLDQLLDEQLAYLSQIGLSTSNNDLLILSNQHKDFENNLLSQASRVQDIRNHVRQEYNSSSHQELRSLVNQTSDHVQNLFTASKNYSDKLEIATKALNLLNNLTNEIIELETRLVSQTSLIDDENHIHRQLTDLHNHIQILEKSMIELLTLSKQLNNDRLIRITEQLATRWKHITSEINQRKRSITQITESHRSFKTLFEQEERVLHQFEKRVQALEPLPTNSETLRGISKTVTDLFHELLSRSQSIEHMNDVAVKLIEEIKMHDKNFKNFYMILCEINSHLKTQQQSMQHTSKKILNKVELFDQRYANLLANMEEYTRLFLKNCHINGQIIYLPIDSASTIVHLYRSTIASRYNLTLDDNDEQSFSSSSAKWAEENNNKTGHRDRFITKGFIDLSNGKVTADRSNNYPLSSSSLDGSISLETTYVIPVREISSSNGLDTNQSNNKKVRFIIQQKQQHQPSMLMTNGNVTSLKSNEVTQRKNLSFVDAVNSKYLDLSTGLFSSSPSSFVLSSSSYSSSSPFSSSTSPPDQHRHSHNHFSSSSSSPPHTTTTTTTTTTITNNKNLLSTPPLSVNNHPPLVGADSATTTANTNTTITLKDAIDTNILDARSAYVVDTLEQRNYDLREAYSRGLINSINHHIIDRAKSKEFNLGEALKMGILKVGDPQSYNVISKTESLIISSVFDHRSNSFIDPNVAIRTKILDPYHGLYLNNLTQETISIDDAMSKGFVIVEQQPPSNAHHHHNDKYVISTSLIRETRSYHLLGVKDYVNNKELSVQDAIRIGILDKQNGQYINRKTNEIFSISEAIAQGHIRAQPLPVESTTNQDNSGNSNIKRGTVKETKTYTLKSAIHPKTRQEIPIRAAIDEGIIDHAKGFYVNSLTGENLPISVAIEKGLIFTELIDLHSRRFVKTLVIEQVIDPVTNRRLGVTEAIKTGLLNSNITIYYHSVTQKQLTILEAYEQGLIIGKFRDSHPSSFYGDQREQVFYLITGVIDIRTDKVYNLQEGIQQKLFDHKKGVYIHPITGDEINIGDAVKRGFIQVQAVSSQIAFNNTEQTLTDKRRAIISQEPYGNTNDSRSKLSIRIESQGRSRAPYEINESETLQREKDVVEIESIQRLPRHKKQYTTREEEIIEHHTTNVVDKEVYVHRNGSNRGKSNERQKQQYIEEVIIDDGINNNRRAKFDIKEDRHTSHREIVIEGDRYVPPPPKDQLIIHDTHREHEVRVVPAARPQPPPPPPRPVHIDDRQREGQRIHHGELIIDDHQRPYPSSSTTQTTMTREYIDITDTRSKPAPIQQEQTHDYQFDEQQSWTEEEWEQWHCIMMIKGQPYRVVWVMNTATGDRLPLQVAYQRNLVDTKQRLFFDEKLNRESYSFEKAVELGYMGIEPDTASLPIHVDGIDYMIHWVLDSSTKRRIFPRPAVRKQILDAVHGRYVNPYNNSQVSLHEAIHLKFIGATEYNSSNDSITVTINGQTYNIKWVYDTRNMKKILPRDALKQGILDIQLNEYRKFDTNDVMTIYDAIQAGYIRCNDDDSSSDNSVRPPSIISVDEDELTIATKTATYVITSVIHPLTQKEIKVSEAIDLGILDKDIGSYKDLVTNVQYELAEAINEGLVYATIIETKEDTEMLTSSVQEIVKKFLVKSVAVDSESQEKIGGLEAQAIGILNYAQGVYHDRKYGVRIPLDKAIERNLLEVELLSQKRFEEYDLELITDTITEKRITLYRIHGVRNNVLDRMESGAVAVRNQMIDTEAKTYTDFSTGETMTIQEAINKNLIQAEISEHVERKPLGLSMQNAIRLGFYVAETGTFRDPATEHYMTLMEAIERGHIHVNGIAFADSEQGPITLYDAFSLGLINRRDGGKLNPAKINLYRARLVESKLHRMNVEDAIRCGLLNLRTGFYKHPHSGEQLNLKEAIQRGLIDGQSTIIEHPTSGRYMSLKDALDGIRIDNEGQVIDSYSNKVITTLELAFNHRKLFSQFDVNAGEVFLPSQNESVGFEKAIRKNLLDNNRMKLFDPKISREYTIQDAIERGLVDQESGLIYDTHSHTQYSVREAIRHGIVAIVGAPLVPIKADHETVAAKITSRKHRRHSLAKSSLHFDYNSAPESADEDSHGSGGWHRIKSRTRAMSPLSIDGASDLRRNIRRRTGSSPSRTCREDDWRKIWKNGNNDDDDDDTFGSGGGGGGSKRTAFYSSVTTRTQETNGASNQTQEGQTSPGFQQKQEQISNLSTVIPKESIISNDEELLRQDNDRLVLDIQNITDRLTLLHNQLNQYVYITENLDELRLNVQEIQKLHSEVENERSIIKNLIQRATSINPQLGILCTDLEEKRVEISDINQNISDIIQRYITEVEQFNTKYTHLTEWLERNTGEIEKDLPLSTLNDENDRLKEILNAGIHLQNDLKSLQESLNTIDLIIKDFQQITESTDDEKPTNLYQQFEQLSKTYIDFLKHCKQLSDQYEHYTNLFNEINHLNNEFLQSLNEFNQHLSVNEKHPHIDNKLQILLLNLQQQLDKLIMLATHESPSPISQHLNTLLEAHTEHYQDAQKRFMHHLKFIERIHHERQTIKERINELYQWLLSSIENDIFSRSLSLKRSKLNEQIIEFRQFHAQVQTRRYSFDFDINSSINLEQLFDHNDKNLLELIDQYFQILNKQTNEYNEQLNHFSTCLNEFHCEHAHLIDTYSKYLRLYSEQIKENDQWDFPALELLLNNEQGRMLDHTLYNQLFKDLIERENIENQNELFELQNQVEEHRIQYETFQNDLKIILRNRQSIFNQYESMKTSIHQWIITTDRLLKQQILPSYEYSKLPIEQFKIITKQLIDFDSSINLLNVSKSTSIYQEQTDELIENYLLIQQRIIHNQQYQLAKQNAENSIEKARELFTLNENLILPLDNQLIEIMVQKYQEIFEQLKSMSSTIDEYKTAGLRLINTTQRSIDIQNQMNSIEKTWSEYNEYILDTLDYLQLHQEDLREFYQLADQLLALLNKKQSHFEKEELEKLYEQIELLNQKGGLLLQNSAIDSTDNQIERLLETIHRTYDNLTTTNNEIPESNSTINELRHHLDELSFAMNELSELIVSSTTDIISAQPMKLAEQLVDNTVVANELEKRRISLEQLHSNIQLITNQEEIDSIKNLEEKLALLNEDWLIMKQANDLHGENLLLTQTCANQFWSEYNEFPAFLEEISKQLLEIRPRSTSREHIEHEQKIFNQLLNDFTNKKQSFEEHSLQLLTFISNNQQETNEIQCSINELEQTWNHIQTDFHTCQNQLSQSMIKSTEFNAKLESVSTWFDETSMEDNNNNFEHIRIVKEHLDKKYIDIVNLKQDYIDIEQADESLIEEQLVQMDSKWNQLNDKIQEHKTLIYETALRQNRIGDVIADITQSLDSCALKLSILTNNLSDNDLKQIEIFIAKFRILMNDIELISYDIEQLKQTDSEDKNSVLLINNRWEELLKQTNEKYHMLENQFEQMKIKQKLFDQFYHELNLIDKQTQQSTINTKFTSIIERLEDIEQEINKKFSDDNNELRKYLIDIKQRTLIKGEELVNLTQSIELFHQTLQKFTEYLSECERYLNAQKPLQRHFRLYQTLLKQMDEHKSFENQCEVYKEHFMNLDKLATHLTFVVPKKDSIYIRNSLISVQRRWEKILTRTNQRTKEFEKMKKIIPSEVADIDKIKTEVHRQTSLCQCSKKYDVQQIAEGRYRFGGSQSLRLVRILRSTVMVRVGGGWTALDEFLVRHDPCRGMHVYNRFLAAIAAAKGRTNYELHPGSYALRDGVAQTMTLFKPRFATIHRPTCLHHQQKLFVTTPSRPVKEKSSMISFTQQSNGDSSISGDDLSVSPRTMNDSESKQSHIPVLSTMYTPGASTMSRTSSRESVLSEQSFISTSSTQRRASKLPLPISRYKKATNGTTPVKNS